jgi:hypothetical protein
VAGLFLDVFSRRFSTFFLPFSWRSNSWRAPTVISLSLAGGCLIELNTDKIWLGIGETGSAKNRSKPGHRRTRPAKAPSILNCG